jgi:hypothetical protein
MAALGKEPDAEVLAALLESLADMVDMLEPAFLQQAMVLKLFEQLKVCARGGGPAGPAGCRRAAWACLRPPFSHPGGGGARSPEPPPAGQSAWPGWPLLTAAPRLPLACAATGRDHGQREAARGAAQAAGHRGL